MLLQTPTLEPRDRELMVLRVAWRTRSRYEWVQHVRLAPRVGITPEEIAAVADGPERRRSWTPLEADLLAATDQLIDGYRVDDDTWARLAEQLDERQLVELVFVVGTYTASGDGVQELRAAARPGAARDRRPHHIPEFEE